MPKVELIAPKFLHQGTGIEISNKTKKDIKNFSAICHHNINKSIEGLLFRINSINSYEELPEKIVFSYNNLIERDLNFKDTLDLVNLTAKLAANKFNEKPKEILFTGFSAGATLDEHYEKIVDAGFMGCLLSPLVYGLEAAKEVTYKFKKDPTYWNTQAISKKKIITKSKPLEIILTFRQEQILQLILKGMTNYQISRRLTISEATVKMHIGIVFKKYGVKNRTQLIFSLKEKIG
jgi:DNA-binding CsgD family transcriptional regulator